MSHEERMKRLNAAFDAMSEGLTEDELAAMTGAKTIDDVLRYRDRIRALARENQILSLHVFEEGPDDAALCLHGRLAFLCFCAEGHKLGHRIRLVQGLRELPGFPTDLIDATLYDEAVIADLVRRAVRI